MRAKNHVCFVHSVSSALTTIFSSLQVLSVDFPMAQTVKHLPATWETWVQPLGQEDLLEKKMASHSSFLAWEIPWTEEPGRLQSIGCKESNMTEWLTLWILEDVFSEPFIWKKLWQSRSWRCLDWNAESTLLFNDKLSWGILFLLPAKAVSPRSDCKIFQKCLQLISKLVMMLESITAY